MAKNDFQKKSGGSEKTLDYILLVFCLLLIVITVYPFLNVLAISLNEKIYTQQLFLHI